MPATFAFTLYEVFGYLIPGAIVEAGLAILYWAIFAQRVQLCIATFSPGIGTWVGGILAAYVLGHGVQAAANKFLRRLENRWITQSLSDQIGNLAQQTSAELLGIANDKIEPRTVFRVLDEYVVQKGVVGDREIFLYREGFYRGEAIALLFLSMALLIRSALPGAIVRFHDSQFVASRWELVVTAGLTVILGILFLDRYKRFVSYRLSRAYLAAVVIRRSLDIKP